jgi:AhpD family alkylhydroperoxidase
MSPEQESSMAAERCERAQPRIKNPATILPEAGGGIQTLIAAVYKGGVPRSTLDLVHLRISQINACGACVDSGSRAAKKSGERDERLFSVAAWRHEPYFSDGERAALALAEEVTRLADRPDAVPDDVWDEAARHYDEKGLAALVLWVALTNLFNRLNVSTRQPAGAW